MSGRECGLCVCVGVSVTTMSITTEVSALLEMEQAVMSELLRLNAEAKERPQDLTPAAFETASATLRSALRRHAERVDQLEQLASSQDRASEEEEALAHVRRHRAENVALAASLRDLAAKIRHNRPLVEAAERAALFSMAEGGKDGEPRAGGTGSSSGVGGVEARVTARAARDLNSSLRRTNQLMVTELQRMDQTMQQLDQQGKSLKGTHNEHQAIDGTLKSGRRKLTRLQ